MVFGDMAAIRRKILDEIGLQFPIQFMLPRTRAFWSVSHVSESDHLRDLGGGLTTVELFDIGTPTWGVDGYMPYTGLNGSSQYFSAADHAGLDITDALTMGGWFYFDNTASAEEAMIGKWREQDNRRSYLLRRDASGNIEAVVSSNGTAEISQASTDIVPSGTWVFSVLRYDPSNELSVFIGQDGGAKGVLKEDLNTTSIPASINVSIADVAVGAVDTTGTAKDYMAGRFGGFGFLCNAVLSDDLLNQLYAQSRQLIDV